MKRRIIRKNKENTEGRRGILSEPTWTRCSKHIKDEEKNKRNAREKEENKVNTKYKRHLYEESHPTLHSSSRPQDECLSEAQELSEEEDPAADQCLRASLDQLCADCARYVSVMRSSSSPVTGRTRLDKERGQWCLQEMVGV